MKAPHIQPGVGTYLARNFTGDSVSLPLVPQWRHPWLTTPAWSALGAQWVATVEPGLVSAVNSIGEGQLQTPVYRATVLEQQDLGNPWEDNPLTGQPFFSDPIFNHDSTSVQEVTIDLPIYLAPAIPLSFYNLGWDGDPTKEVLPFFLQRGAAKAPKQPSLDDLLSGDDSLDNTPPPDGLRLLRGCDVWLHQPRLGLSSSITVGDGIDGQSNVTQQLTVAQPAPTDALQILTGAFVPDTQSIDLEQSDYTEPTFDQILISTVYLLSPPNTAPGSVPDGTWQPFVKHNLFWNLQWAQPTLNYQPPPVDAGLSSLSFLGDGSGGTVINYLSAQLNDSLQAAQNAAAANSLAGVFWTATGGGHDSTTALPVATTPKLGPDIYTNLAMTQAAQRAAQLSGQLDPDFPYTAQPFPLSLLTS